MRVNEADLDWDDIDRGDATFRRKRLADAAGGEGLGASLYEIPPGEKGWPYHYHEGNEEAVYVLGGSGSIRLAGETQPLEAGDYVALVPGPDSAHRIVNDGDDPLRFLVVSEMDHPDVLGYPDSDKVGVYTGSPPGQYDDRRETAYFPRESEVDYWEGEGESEPDAGE